MIHISEVKKEMQSILATDRKELKVSEDNRLKKRFVFLQLIHNYLQESPTEEFVKKELDRLDNRVSLLGNNYPDLPLADRKTQQAAIKAYEKEMGIPLLKLQIKSLRFLLKD